MHVLVNLVSDLRESCASHTYSKIEKVSIRRQNQAQLSEALPFFFVGAIQVHPEIPETEQKK